MILPDTSAWVAYLRGSNEPVADRLFELIRDGAELATTGPIVMEVLAGATSDDDLLRTRDELLGLQVVARTGLSDYEEAAALFRTCRRGGSTIRSMIDCLIAVVAMRIDASVLHADRDFDAIARHSRLKIHPSRG